MPAAMRWRRGGSRSGNVIDARGGGGRRAGGLPGGRVALPGGLGVAGVIVFLAIQLLGGGAAFSVPTGFEDGATARDVRGIPPGQDPEKDLKDFSAYVFDNAQEMWRGTLRGYRDAKLVLFRDGVSTGCGSASSAVGPFYCPADQRVYLDLSFYGDMERQLGAPGDFAWAYVIAHEVGHHVQTLTGASDEVRRLQRDDPGNANALSVRLELQADCYAGVWAHSVFEAGDLEPGDVDEAIRASEAVGDDRLQRRAGGDVRPDSFTHGSSEQRARWFRTGQAAGEPAACDTFSADDV
jgi:predicted metalloprotease